MPHTLVALVVTAHDPVWDSLRRALEPAGYDTRRASSGARALAAAGESELDAVFVDLSLPDMSGTDLCRRVSATGLVGRATPIVLVTTGPAGDTQRIEALRAGAWEVIQFPVDPEELRLRLSRYIRARQEVDRARSDLVIDPETQVYSQAGILRRIREVAAAAERHGRPVACIMFDVNSSGADRAEQFFAEIAAALNKLTRRSDIIGRIGRSQFIIVAPDTEGSGAETIAERLREHGSTGDRVGGPGGDPPRIGVYVVESAREAALDPEDLVDRAAQASRDPTGTEPTP